MKIISEHKSITWIILGALIGGSLVFGFFLLSKKQSDNLRHLPPAQLISYPEAQDLQGKELSFKDLTKYFGSLAEKKGAPYALDVLRVAPIPTGIDMHLLAHTVGDILYKQEGIKGIKTCTQDFRNACSHSIVVGFLLEKGEGALPQIAEICREAPGGSGAYTMCFHGLGHGVLAYADYNLEKAAELCKKTGTAQFGNSEYPQCISGTIMEMIAGVHNRQAWEKQVKKYFKKDDPLYPCTADFIPTEAKPLCYVYLTPHLFEAAGADLANPLPEHFKKAFPFCNKIPATDAVNRDACYGGFGKEFIVLVQGRDIRRVDDSTDEQLKTVYEWCRLADVKEGTAACIVHATQSLYWGGENKRDAAIRFCYLIDDQYYRGSCFTNLIGAVSFYIRDIKYRQDFCREIPREFRDVCTAKLLNS